MVIKKVFNNNVVFARDNSGQEVILMGKGIGFNKFTKDLVEIDKIEKKFIFNNEESLSELHSLLDRIPLKDVELVSEIIQMGREELGDNLNDSILITLSEHISYMLKRMDEGLVFQSPLQWEIRQIYPNEYNFSKKAVEYLRKKLDKNIPDSEIAFTCGKVPHPISAVITPKTAKIFASQVHLLPIPF